MRERVNVSGSLFDIGCAGEARHCLRRMAAECRTAEEALSVAETAIKIHDWSLARQQYSALAHDEAAKLSTRIETAEGLGRTGLGEAGCRILVGLDKENEDDVFSSFSALLACGRDTQAIESCQNYLKRTEIDLLDRIEVAAWVGRRYRKDIARVMLLEAVDGRKDEIAGRSRAAEILSEMEYAADARTILFGLREELLETPEPDPDDLLWVVEAMLTCELGHSAQSILSQNRQRYPRRRVCRPIRKCHSRG